MIVYDERVRMQAKHAVGLAGPESCLSSILHNESKLR